MKTNYSRVPCWVCGLLLLLIVGSVAIAYTPPPVRLVTVRVVDPAGNAVRAAKIGNRYSQQRDKPTWGVRVHHSLFNDKSGHPALTNAKGMVTIPREACILPGFEALCAIHPQTGLVGVKYLKREDLDRPVEIRLEPACLVVGRTELADIDAAVGFRTFANVSWNNVQFFVNDASDNGTIELLLPPGEYACRLSAQSTGTVVEERQGGFTTAYGELDTELHWVKLTIAPRQTFLDLGTIRLNPTATARLLGQVAPEIRTRDWRNSDTPLALADLRGQVVLLDFWGYDCGPCVAGMRYVMHLHDKYASKGLIVIAVHHGYDHDVTSLAQVDDKVAKYRAEYWKRDLPMPVALDLPENDPAGTSFRAYGIHSIPIYALIDRSGKIVDIGHTPPEEKVIEHILGLDAQPAGHTSK